MNTSEFFQTLDSFGFHFFWVLISFLWESLIILTAVFILSRFIKQKSASVRFTLWITVLFIISVLPILSWVSSSLGAPQVKIPIIPSHSITRLKTASPVEKSIQTGSPVNTPETEDTIPHLPDTYNDVSITSQDHSASADMEDIENRFLSAFYPWAIILIAYVIGAGYFLLKIFFGWLRISRWINKSRVVLDEHVIKVFREAGNRLGLRKDFIIVESENIVVPMVMGFFHHFVLLPSGCIENCSSTELQALALHELAHVRRNGAIKTAGKRCHD